MAGDQRDNLALADTIGSVLWFVTDGVCMLNQALPAKAMVAPTLAINLLVFRFTKRSFSHVRGCRQFMAPHEHFVDVGRFGRRPVAVARIVFVLGIVLLALAVAGDAAHPERLARVFARFRRMKI